MKENELKTHNEVEKKKMALSYYLPDIIQELESAGKFTSVHTYRCTLNSFAHFCRDHDIPMTLHEVFTLATLKAYQAWLLGRGLSWNTISTYMRTLRAIYNRIFAMLLPDSCLASGTIVFYYNPKLFAGVYTKVESRTKRALSHKQTQVLMTYDLQTLPDNLSRALAYFRLMFLFRGMAFIDLAYLRKCDIHNNKIIYCRHKTGCELTVSIPKEALPLIKEFKSRTPDSVYLFPILDNCPDASRKQYRNYLKALNKFNKLLSKVVAQLLPGSKLSSYTARHSWATLSYHQGTPVGIISKALGHSSIRVTETYLKPFENHCIDRANDKLIASLVLRNFRK